MPKILVVANSEEDRSKIIEYLVIASPDYKGYGAGSIEELETHLKDKEDGEISALISDCHLNDEKVTVLIDKVREQVPKLPIILTPTIDEVEMVADLYSEYNIFDVYMKEYPLKYLECMLKSGLKG